MDEVTVLVQSRLGTVLRHWIEFTLRLTQEGSNLENHRGLPVSLAPVGGDGESSVEF